MGRPNRPRSATPEQLVGGSQSKARAASSEEEAERGGGKKKEAMARRLHRMHTQRRALKVLGAWRAWASKRALRHHRRSPDVHKTKSRSATPEELHGHSRSASPEEVAMLRGEVDRAKREVAAALEGEKARHAAVEAEAAAEQQRRDAAAAAEREAAAADAEALRSRVSELGEQLDGAREQLRVATRHHELAIGGMSVQLEGAKRAASEQLAELNKAREALKGETAVSREQKAAAARASAEQRDLLDDLKQRLHASEKVSAVRLLQNASLQRMMRRALGEKKSLREAADAADARCARLQHENDMLRL